MSIQMNAKEAKYDHREVARAIKSLVHKVGVADLAKRLKVTPAAVYFWLGAGSRKSNPKPDTAKRLLKLKARLATVRKEA
jgi:hypothetical protein